MSVAEFKAQAMKLSRGELRELSVYFHGLAARKKPVWRAGTKRTPKMTMAALSSDPLLNLDKFSVAGVGGKLTNGEIDRILYGQS